MSCFCPKVRSCGNRAVRRELRCDFRNALGVRAREGGGGEALVERRSLVSVILLILLFAFGNASARRQDHAQRAGNTPADSSGFSPNANLEFSIPRVFPAPKIDGKLDDPAWQTATRIGNFTEVTPGDNVRPAEDTEVLVAYDGDHLYLGFVCYDTSPRDIRASITDRDNIGRDDFAGVLIDTFKDQQTSYEFFVNPYGVQFDQRRSNAGEDDTFDTVWESAGEINSIGWTAEMAIPFRSLRFPNRNVQEWGVHFLRVRPRNSREQISWAPLSRDESCLFCQEGTMRGIEGVHTGRNVELLPYVIGSELGRLQDDENPDSKFLNDHPKFEGGLGIKYGITPNLTFDGTINPDFSQVESDAPQISLNTTFALFLDEKRPFFLEGGDVFRSEIQAVYTRSINDPRGAAKVTGKSGKYTLGYILAQDANASFIVPFEDNSELVLAGKAWSNIARIKRDLWSDSFVGLMATDRRYTDGANTSLGLDWDIRFKENYNVSGQILGSYTEEPNDPSLSESFNGGTFGEGKYTTDFDGETFAGYGLHTSFERSARHWNMLAIYEDFSPAFRLDNGFISANNFRSGMVWNGLTLQPNNAVLDMIQPAVNVGRKYKHTGGYKDRWIEPELFVQFKKQTWVEVSYIWSKELFKDVLVDGIGRFQVETGTSFSRRLTASAAIRQGNSVFRRTDEPFLAKERTIEAEAVFRPTSRLSLGAEYLYQRFDQIEGTATVIPHEDHKEYSVRNELTYQFSKRLFFRIIGQYVKRAGSGGSVEFDPLVSYKINPFSVFFIGSTHNFTDYGSREADADTDFQQTERTFFVKFQYLFRI